nr:anhydro-N-acetylmuramic acid kinase [Marinicella sp. W31]MDC2877196.1 anhydro-N-acetylmuramic acid kinase [Marinicella sp. W31]
MAEDFKPVWAVGLMTGTVLDGNIDVALVKTDGATVEAFGVYTLAPYPQATRDLLEETLAAARKWNFEGPEPKIFAEAEKVLTRAQSDAVRALVESERMSMADIAVVGFHGQSVLHRAPQKERLGDTRQLGDGALMARILGCKVAYDFRTADIRAGGQGAPLSAAYHQALLKSLDTSGKTAVLNLGGVANVTWWDGDQRLIAFDTGPANAPLNDFMKANGLGEMDRDGALALSGTVDEARLSKLLKHPYLAAPYPKSLDRFDFSAAMAEGLDPATGAATLTAFTAGAVGKALDLCPRVPNAWSSAAAADATRQSWRCSKAVPGLRQCRPRRWAGAVMRSRLNASRFWRSGRCAALLELSDDDRRTGTDDRWPDCRVMFNRVGDNSKCSSLRLLRAGFKSS